MCSACQGTGWVQELLPGGFTASKRCLCRQIGQGMPKHDRLRVPPRFADATFDNFSAGDHARESQTYNVLTAAMWRGRRFADDYPTGPSNGLLFHGGTMQRQTHLAVATLKRLADRGFSCLFVDYQHLLQVLQRRFEDGADELEETASLVNSVDVLLIESLGERRPTDWALDTIYAIIKNRYHNKMGLLATTGLPLATAAFGIEPGPQATYGTARSEDTLAQRIGRQCFEMLDSICVKVPVAVPKSEQRSQSRTATTRAHRIALKAE